MCIQWITPAACPGLANDTNNNTTQRPSRCAGAHVVVTRREVCERATPERCICFFGSCGDIVTLALDQQPTVSAPCQSCGALDGDPEMVMFLRVFDKQFAAEWNVAYGEAHYRTCTDGRWRGRYGEPGVEDAQI
ncbi:hypothetical protein CMUS01_09422 [Colletotrichum musicola]|uniref:Uncharacterized protein n=1 Tax=Colletotrichum musicola TaxID=2175873 RepID=A0A8H6K7I4_9PEZI|nr:hypothetical protein CMUS01_09422 [Colletotrichum musicola]